MIEACARASTGAQRIGLFVAIVWQLPSIWKELC